MILKRGVKTHVIRQSYRFRIFDNVISIMIDIAKVFFNFVLNLEVFLYDFQTRAIAGPKSRQKTFADFEL